MNIITGYTGEPHITSAQDRDGNQGSYGEGSYILNIGDKLAASIVSANEIRIADGALSHQGCLGNIDRGSYESLAISNGEQGLKRRDLIVCRYEKDAETNIENLSLVVIEGVAGSSPVDPEYNTGNIQDGDSPVDFPLYRVNINGVNVSSVTRIAEYVRTQKEADALLGNTNISNIGNGTLTGAVSNVNNNAFKMPFGGDIGSGVDLDNLITPGYYRTLGSTNQAANLPTTVVYGAVYVVYIGGLVHQYVLRPEGDIFYIRARSGNPPTWFPWRKVTTTVAQ